MNPTDLDAVQKLCDAASGVLPWHLTAARDAAVRKSARTLVPQMAAEIRELRAELAAERARTDALVAATEFVFVVPAHLPGRTHRAVRDGENWRIERHMMPTLGVSTWGQVEEHGDQATAVRRARELAGLSEEERERPRAERAVTTGAREEAIAHARRLAAGGEGET